MASLLYYIPAARVEAIPEPTLQEWLTARLQLQAGEATEIASSLLEPGPDGGRGHLLAIGTVAAPDSGLRSYAPAAQTWQPEPEHVPPHYWLGWDTAEPPAPEDLLRPEPCGGHLTRLGDGALWLVPAARTIEGGSMLHKGIGIGPGGALVAAVLPRFCAFSAKAEALWQHIYGSLEQDETATESTATMEDKEAYLLAVEALAINYRLSTAEATVLGLLPEPSLDAVLRAIVDFPSLEAFGRAIAASKKAAAEAPRPGPSAISSSSAGHEGTTPATPPPLQSGSGSAGSTGSPTP